MSASARNSDPNRKVAKRSATKKATARVAAKQAERWLAESQEAIASSNAYVAAHGLPLEKHRAF